MEHWWSMGFDWWMIGFGSGLVGGFFLGVEMGYRRWRRNADEIQRVEWRGRLYKVEHAEWQSVHHL